MKKPIALTLVLLILLAFVLSLTAAVDAKPKARRAVPARITLTPEYGCMKQGGCQPPIRVTITPEYGCMKQGGC